VELSKEQRLGIQRLCAAHRQRDRKTHPHSLSITWQQWVAIYEKQQGKCYYTGLPMTLPVYSQEDTSINVPKLTDASLDRVDNNLPHTVDNVVLCHRQLNHGRNSAEQRELIAYLKYIGAAISNTHQ
jgi:hypothetical protein